MPEYTHERMRVQKVVVLKENSFDLRDPLKVSWRSSGVPGPYFENHWSTFLIYMKWIWLSFLFDRGPK